jgi:HAMP domain-containing protein
MTASTAAPDLASRTIVHRYYLAMAVPFGIDVATSAVYAFINAHPLVLLPMALVSAVFLLLGVHRRLAADPTGAALPGQRPCLRQVGHAITSLPLRSALLIAAFYAPMLALRLLSARVGITFGATIEVAAWIDTVCTFLVVTSFNVVLAFFIISAYLDRLCEHLFRTRGVNIATFHGVFRRKVGLAVLFGAFAAMTLLGGDIASYSGDRLIREATVDVSASVVAAATIYFWITRALTGPIDRLDSGMRRVADNDLSVRLPVTSDDEVGHATSGFNRMVEGLAERQYLRTPSANT